MIRNQRNVKIYVIFALYILCDMNDSILYIKRYDSPAGDMVLGSAQGRLCICDWSCSKRNSDNIRRAAEYYKARVVDGCDEVILSAAVQLDEYFSGCRCSFDIPLAPVGTDFQQTVWSVLSTIPYSSTVTYSDVASIAGRPRAVRAVASAIGANPLSIFVPCHRVVGVSGIGGYAGSVAAKLLLLELESSASVGKGEVKA